MNWARRQTCGVTARKAVLLALANWADAEGFVKRIRIDYLEQTTELSRPGVYLRLRELEAGGAITRTRGLDKNGLVVSATLNLDGGYRTPVVGGSAEVSPSEYYR
jgi:hypothetical protein